MIIEKEQLKQLGNYVVAKMQSVGCDNTLYFTKKWLAEHHIENAPAVVELLEENSGFCDCEVLFNAMDRLLDNHYNEKWQLFQNTLEYLLSEGYSSDEAIRKAEERVQAEYGDECEDGEDIEYEPSPSTKMYQLTLDQIQEEKNRLN